MTITEGLKRRIEAALAWLDSPAGWQFLASPPGQWFLGSEVGRRFLNSDAGQRFLDSEDGEADWSAALLDDIEAAMQEDDKR